MLCKKPYLVPIPGTRRLSRLLENAGAADVTLSAEEVSDIDEALNGMEMSEVFGGSKTVYVRTEGLAMIFLRLRRVRMYVLLS